MKQNLLNKKIKLSILLTLAFSMINLISYTYSNNTPPVSLTNAPSEGNCTSCHGGNALVSSGNQWNNITLTANGGALEYFPDSSFNMLLTADISGITKYGFEVTVLDSVTNKAIGTMTVTNSTTTSKSTNNVNGAAREYIMHKPAGTAAQNANQITWDFKFKAPSTMPKAIKFYVTVNATNSNGGSSGDEIYAKVFTMRPSPLLPKTKVSVSNATICSGDTLFCSSQSTNVTNYQWYVLNGNTKKDSATASNPYFIINTAATYKIKLTGSNNKGSIADSTTVKVNQKPSVSITPSKSNTNICSTDSVVLTSNATAGSSIFWNNGATTNAITVKTSGSFYAQAILNGCKDSSSAVAVNVSQKLSAPTLNCGNTTLNSITYTWQSVNGATGYEVSENGGNTWIQPSGNNSHTRSGLSSNTSYKLWVKALDNAPCNDGIIDSISCITNNCNATSYKVSFDSMLCEGVNDTIRFNITSTNSFAILFNNIYSTNTEYIVNANTDSIYSFELIDSNQLTCTSTKVQIPVKRSIMSGITASNIGSGSCEGVSQSFQATGGFAKYIFKDKQGNVLQNSSSNIYNTSDKNIITAGVDVTVLNSFGCSKNIAATGGTVVNTPVAVFKDSIISVGKFQFQTTSSVSVKSVWDFGDGTTDTTNQKTIIHSYTSHGKYLVKLTENNQGCSDDSTKQIDAGNLGIVKPQSSKDIYIYPNPMSDYLTIDLTSMTEKVQSVQLMDISGQVKFYLSDNQILTNSLVEIATYNLASGVYIIKVNTINGTSSFQKVLKY
jgi:PKD repeat protein